MTLLSGEFIAGVTDKVKSSPLVKVSGVSFVTEGLEKRRIGC